MNEQMLKELFYNDVFQEVEPEVGEDGRYHGLYVIQNQINYKFYVGKHSSDSPLTDGYFGSGVALKRGIRKYGKDNFKMKYFHWSESDEQVHLDEDEVIGIVLDDIFEGDWQALNKVMYNLKRNQGFSMFNDETRIKISVNTSLAMKALGRTGEKNHMYGITGINHNKFKGYSVGYDGDAVIICDGKASMVNSGFNHRKVYACINDSERVKTHKGYKWIRTVDKQVIDELLTTRKLFDARSIELYNQMGK